MLNIVYSIIYGIIEGITECGFLTVNFKKNSCKY